MGTTNTFAEYLQTMVNIQEIERITNDLDHELADSQRAMNEIQAIFDSIPKQSAPVNYDLRHEDVSKYLESGPPNLLLPDMEMTLDVDMENTTTNIRSYCERLKKKLEVSPFKEPGSHQEITELDLEQYSASLDQLRKKLANLNIRKTLSSNRCPELEDKLTQLCQDVNMFTKLVQAKTTLHECNKNWRETQQDSVALQYDSDITKLLSAINEVTYLLKNKN